MRPLSPRAEALLEGAKASPPVTVAGLVLGGVSLQDWVLLAALAYTVLQAGYLIWKWRREWLAKRSQ